MEVYFVRHGATQWNREHRHQGRLSGIGLDAQGREQVTDQARALPRRPYVAVVSSPLQRAVETADILRMASGLDAPLVRDSHFDEWAIPPWDRLTFGEIAIRFPDAYETYIRNPDVFSMPSAERLADVRDRALEGLHLLEVTHGASACVLIVTHAAVISAAVIGVLGAPLALYRKLPVSNASLTVIRTGCEPTLELFNWYPNRL